MSPYKVEALTISDVTISVLAPTGQVLRKVVMTWETLRKAARHEDATVRAVYERLLAQARGLADRGGLGWRGSRKVADRMQLDYHCRQDVAGARHEVVWVDPDHARAMLLGRESPTWA